MISAEPAKTKPAQRTLTTRQRALQVADWTFAAVYGSLTLLFLAASIGQPDPHPWIRAMGRLFTADTALSATLLLLAGLSLRRTRAIRVIAHALAYAMVLLPVGLWLFLLIAQRMAVTG